MKSFNDITRRDFLKSVGLVAAATTFGCATAQTPKPDVASSIAAVKPEPIVYPKLPGNKVQAPEDGCMVGLRKVYGTLGGAARQRDSMNEFSEASRKATNLDELLKLQKPVSDKYAPILLKNLATIITHYQEALAAKPRIIVMYESPRIYTDFKTDQAELIANKGGVPYANAGVYSWAENFSLKLGDIINGKYDKHIVEHAKGARQFGEKHGGFFMTTMEEANGDWNYWCQNSQFVPAWRHIWQIFEDQGANQYATWVWEVSCPEPHIERPIAPPDSVYPGDKYVDWIGLSGFSRRMLRSGSMTFDGIAQKSYENMRKNHPEKPIMQAEFAASNDWGQPRWIKKAYETIKNSMPGMKAAIFWDNITLSPNDDHTLSEKSLQAMKEIFKDPYWIMAK